MKFLFVSGYTGDVINKEGLVEKDLAFLSKPVKPHNLLDKIRGILDGRG